MLSYPSITMLIQNKEQSESHSPGTSNNFVAPRQQLCEQLNNPTLDPSPDPAALIGPGLSGSPALIGGVAEQQAAGWTVQCSVHPPRPHGTITHRG